MQSRDALLEAIPDLDERVAFLAFDQINKLLEPAEDAIGHRQPLFFKDGLEQAREVFAKLKVAHQFFAETMFLEEQSRQQYTIPEALYQSLKQAELALTAAQRKYRVLQKNIALEKDQLRDKESQLSRDSQNKRLDISNKLGREIEEQNLKYNKLNAERDELLEQQERLNAEISRKCCSCFPWRTARERDKLLKVEVELETKVREIRMIEVNRAERKKEESELRVMMDELRETRIALSKHNESMAKRLRTAEQAVFERQKKVGRKSIAIEKQRSRYNASQSVLAMMHALRLYHYFLDFQLEIDRHYGQHQRKHGRLRTLRILLSETKKRLDEYLQQMWVPHARNMPGDALYRKFLVLTEEEQLAFLADDHAPAVAKVLEIKDRRIFDLLEEGAKPPADTMRFFSLSLRESDGEHSETLVSEGDSQSVKPQLSAV